MKKVLEALDIFTDKLLAYSPKKKKKRKKKLVKNKRNCMPKSQPMRLDSAC